MPEPSKALVEELQRARTRAKDKFDALQQSISSFLEANPNSTIQQIANGTKSKPAEVERVVRSMKRLGAVEQVEIFRLRKQTRRRKGGNV